MPAARTRRLLRSALLLAILGGVGALIGITVVSRPGEPKAEATEGWTVRGFRQTRYDGGTPVLSVSAEEARLERPRFGPFRIGVARRLVVHEAKVDLLAGAATADRAGASAGGLPWKAAPRTLQASAITAVRVEGLNLRVRRPDMESLELHADRCEGSFLAGGQLVCRGGVRVTGGGVERRFAELRYDRAAARLVTTPPGAMEEMNFAIRAALPQVSALLSALAAGG